jgi:multiple sugar transport system permease protein
VAYAIADVGGARLILLPFEHVHRPTSVMIAAVVVGLLIGVPLIALASTVGDARRTRRELAAWSFLAPGLLHLAAFTIGPLAFAAWLSLHRWSLVDPARPFVGLGNYTALASNAGFWNALLNTALFTLHVPFSMALALGLALLVRRPGRASVLARAAFFLPSITSLVAVAMVWQWILNDEYGLANAAFEAVGLPRLRWLSSPSLALVSIMIVATWTTVGFQTVLFQAGLTAIPSDLYDAARIDGASRWRQFVHVTLPGLRPTLVFVLITSVISSFQVFGTVYVMTEGGPLHATDVAVFHIYEEAWELQRVGSAAAMSWTLFAVIFAVTWLHFRTLEQRAEA